MLSPRIEGFTGNGTDGCDGVVECVSQQRQAAFVGLFGEPLDGLNAPDRVGVGDSKFQGAGRRSGASAQARAGSRAALRSQYKYARPRDAFDDKEILPVEQGA